MHLPIGVSDFRKLMEYKSPISGNGYLFVDKSLLIRELLDDLTEVIVITRPRRFGKTLNLSMLQHFFAAVVEGKSTAGLFKCLEISKHSDCMQLQGKHPVIFITLKDTKANNYKSAINKIYEQIRQLYEQHRYVIEDNKISKEEKERFISILNKTANIDDLSFALHNLSYYIHKTLGQLVYILIDEYDTPIQESYIKGYYEPFISFIRGFLGSALKGNSNARQSILTGILRISKESLFSDINNVEIYSVLNKEYSSYFGFTEDETNNLLLRSKLPIDSAETKEWYNGYKFGDTTIYNPLSIIKFIKEKGQIGPYWINTSGNELIKTLLINPEAISEGKLEKLVTGNTIREIIDEHIVFKDIDKNKAAIWSLFVMSGYLKILSITNAEYGKLCELAIPNKEVEFLYKQTFMEWVSGKGGINWYLEFIDDLADGRVIKFAEKLQTFITETLSCHDVGHKTQEAFYHGLILAFVCGLKDTHIVKSNKESGLGFYDIAVIPKNIKKLGIVMEFKATEEENKLETEAKKALEQINKSNYIVELKQQNINNICKIGIAFSRRFVKIHHEVN